MKTAHHFEMQKAERIPVRVETNGTPRLVGGSTDREGRVEVCVGGRWGTVQTSNSLEVAETVCRSQSQTLDFHSTSPSYG